MTGIYPHIVNGHLYYRAMGFFKSHRFILYQGKSKTAANKARRHWEREIWPTLRNNEECIARVRRLYTRTRRP